MEPFQIIWLFVNFGIGVVAIIYAVQTFLKCSGRLRAVIIFLILAVGVGITFQILGILDVITTNLRIGLNTVMLSLLAAIAMVLNEMMDKLHKENSKSLKKK